MRRWVLVIVVLGCNKTSASQAALVRADIATMRANAASYAAKEQKALIETKLVPRADLGSCPVAIHEVDDTRMGVIEREQLAQSAPPLALHVVEQAQSFEEDLPPRRSGAPPVSLEGAALVAAAHEAATQKWDWDLVVVADEWTSAKNDVLGSAFTPGRIRGRAFVYDFAADKIVCAADVDVVSSSEVNVTRNGRRIGQDFGGDLQSDLAHNAVRMAVSGLVAAGPAPR